MADVTDSMESNIDAKPALMPVLHDLNTPLCHLCEKRGGTMRICRQAGNISAIFEKRVTNTTNEGLGEERYIIEERIGQKSIAEKFCTSDTRLRNILLALYS